MNFYEMVYLEVILKSMRVNNRLLISFVLSFLYVAMGTYEILNDAGIGRSVDSFYDGLDFFIVYPSHAVGSAYWWFFGGAQADTVYWAFIGQLVTLIVFTLIFYILLWFLAFVAYQISARV